MDVKRIFGVSTLVAGIGEAGLIGVGLGTAGADPGQPCGARNAPVCAPLQQQGPGQPGPNDWQRGQNKWQDGQNNWQGSHDNNNWQGGHDNNNWQGGQNNWQPAPDDWQHRGIDQGRQDHQPFMWAANR